MEKGGKLLKYLVSLKEKYNMEQGDIDKIIELISDMLLKQ